MRLVHRYRAIKEWKSQRQLGNHTLELELERTIGVHGFDSRLFKGQVGMSLLGVLIIGVGSGSCFGVV